MTESDYWLHLEFRVCSEFAGMRENHRRFRWCDGFIPCTSELTLPSDRITGRAWICDSRKQEEWDFVLLLSFNYCSRDEIDWASLLPAHDVSKWMTIDIRNKRIEIEPAAAVAEAP